MCQMNVMFEHDGEQKQVMENVTLLEVTGEGVLVSTFFEEPRLVREARVKSIDFLGGTVTLDKRIPERD